MDGIPPLEGEEIGEEPLWVTWLKRILVTAVIIAVLEYVGVQPVPQKRDNHNDNKAPQQEKEEEVMATMQYTELTTSGDEKVAVDHDDEMSQELELNDGANNKTTPAAKQGATVDEATAYDTQKDETATDINVVHDKVDNDKDEDDDDEDIYGEDDDVEDNQNKENEGDEVEAPQDEKKEVNDNDDNTPTATSNNNSSTASITSSDNNTTTPNKPPLKFRNKSIHHPGMEGFHRWYDIETSLFRQYNVGRTDGVDVIPPYVKKSRNGQVRVALRVVNEFTLDPTQRINVYWINYLGHEEQRGSIVRGETWYQTTYVEHPWVFRTSDTEELLLHYIPERVIPHLDKVPTVEEDHPMVGVQRFVIRRPTDQAIRDHNICSIDDKVMPHPASHHFYNPNLAHTWTLLQMQRMQYFDYNPGATLLQKYLTNIAMHPDNPSYRHIRIANRKFASGIWNSAARGLLLAAGFVEQHAYAELGTDQPLSKGMVQDVSLVLYRLEQCLIQLGQQQSDDNNAATREQPEGADGSGRAGYGRAGQMNFRR